MTKSGGYKSYVWYCSHCGDGPQNFTIQVACPQCYRQRDANAHVEELISIESQLRAVPPSSRPPPSKFHVAPLSAPLGTYPASLEIGDYAIAHNTVKSEIAPPADIGTALESKVTLGNVPSGILESALPQRSLKEPSSSPSAYETSASPSSTDSQTDYEHLNEDVVDPTDPIPSLDLTRQRARYLTQLILGGVQFDVDFEAKVIKCTGRSRTTDGHSTQGSSSGKGNGDTGSGSGSGSSSSSGPKRGRQGDQDDFEQDGDSRRSRQPKSRKRKVQNEEGNKRLACPFLKRNPRARTLHEACSRSSWTDNWRVKEHLFRDHIVYQCDCQEIFPTAKDLDGHCQQQLASCLKLSGLPKRPIFAINQDSAKLLRPRMSFECREAGWRWMFATIFPYVPDKQIPSPYYEDEDPLNKGAYFEDASTGPSYEHPWDLLVSRLPGRTFGHLERRIQYLIQGDDGSGYQGILDAIRRNEFREVLEQSLSDALRGFCDEISRPQQNESVIMNTIGEISAQESRPVGQIEHTSDADDLLNSAHTTSGGNAEPESYLPGITADASLLDDWTFNVDLSGFAADMAFFQDPSPDTQNLSEADVFESSDPFQDALLPDAGPSAAFPVADQRSFAQGPTNEEQQRVVAANRQAYMDRLGKPDQGTWVPEITGNLFGGR